MRVDIRPAIYSDIPKLVRIKLLARGENCNPDSARVDSETRYLTAFLDDKESIFVQLVDKVPISFCAVKDCSVKPFFGYAFIRDLYVLPEWQSKGFGKKLLMHTLRTMRGKGYMNAVLETSEDNNLAQRFYEKFGFVRSKAEIHSGYFTYTIDF